VREPLGRGAWWGLTVYVYCTIKAELFERKIRHDFLLRAWPNASCFSGSEKPRARLTQFVQRLRPLTVTVGDEASPRSSFAPPADDCGQSNNRQKNQYLQHDRPEVMPDKGPGNKLPGRIAAMDVRENGDWREVMLPAQRPPHRDAVRYPSVDRQIIEKEVRTIEREKGEGESPHYFSLCPPAEHGDKSREEERPPEAMADSLMESVRLAKKKARKKITIWGAGGKAIAQQRAPALWSASTPARALIRGPGG
jgi:hypothetical protein